MPGDEGGWHETIILPDEIINNSPSRRHGISEETELHHRIFGCELIQEAGILLKSPQVVMATGQNLLQRFYYRQSLTNDQPSKRFQCDAFSVAMGCLFLSCKVEESPRRPRDVIAVFHRMLFRRKGLFPEHLEFTSEAYFQMKSTLFDIERIILKELGFSFYNIMDHPHKFILYYIKVLQCEQDMAQKAWNYLNDSLRIDCCVRYRAELVACAAIYMAARDLQKRLPESPPWWELFGVTMAEIKQVGNKILSLYHQPCVRWLEPLHPRALVAEGEFHKLQKNRKAVAASGTGALLTTSPVVISSTPGTTEGTPAGGLRAKAEKTPDDARARAREGAEDKGPGLVEGGGGGGGGGGEGGGLAATREEVTGLKSPSPSVDARAEPEKSRSRDRSSKKRRSRTRSRSPVSHKDRSRYRDRDRHHHRDRDRSRSRDRKNRDRRRSRSRDRKGGRR